MSDSNRHTTEDKSEADRSSGKSAEENKTALEQVTTAAETAYEQGSEYLSRNVRSYPLSALLIGGAVGYGLGYLLSRR